LEDNLLSGHPVDPLELSSSFIQAIEEVLQAVVKAAACFAFVVLLTFVTG
jgi:hypothetical protein